MKRSEIKRGTTPMKRTRLRPMSKTRQSVMRRRSEALEAAFGPRDGWMCWFRENRLTGFPACYGELAGHEILKRSRAGSADENLLDVSRIVILCSLHNSWVEDNPVQAHELGLALHAWEVTS